MVQSRLLFRSIFLFMTALALLAPRSGHAQAPVERASLELFRDSIGALRDTTALLGLEKRLISVARVDRDSVMLHLKLGFLALRVGDLGGQSHYEDAASEFTWATELKPDWPYGWYGLGLAETGVGEPQISFIAGLQQMFGKDHLTRAAMAFARAATVDPSFVKGLVELSNTALRQRVNIKLELALDALRLASGTKAADDPSFQLVRGQVEREIGDPDSAIVAFHRYLEVGGTRSLGLLELARSEFVKGNLTGVKPYYDGAAIDDTATVAEYRHDISLIAADSMLRRFDATAGAERAAFLRTFWSDRAWRQLRTPDERLREHYRRIHYAKRNFALVSPNRHYDIIERYRSGSTDFDDRGIIYIRHGEPDARATLTGHDLEANETWRFDRADGNLVFHFVAREDVQDYKLVESVQDLLGFAESVRLRSDQEGVTRRGVYDDLLQSRERIAPIYSRLQAAGLTSVNLQGEERRLGQRSIEIGTTTDSYELDYDVALPLRSNVIALGGGEEANRVFVTYAIPGTELVPVRTAQGNVYPIRVRVAFQDRSGHTVSTLDTTSYFLNQGTIPPGEHLVGKVMLPVPPGRLTYRLALQEGDGRGVVFATDSLTVAPLNGTTFAVSDLVLGWRSANLRWVSSRGDTVFFNPTNTYRPGTEMEVYYEVYGLPSGTEYRTQLVVEKQGSGGLFGLFGKSKPISLSFTDRADGAATEVRRSIALDKLKPGRYELQLIITSPDGQKETRKRPFTVAADGSTAAR